MLRNRYPGVQPFKTSDRDLLILAESSYNHYLHLKTEGTSTQAHLSILVAEVRRILLQLGRKLELRRMFFLISGV